MNEHPWRRAGLEWLLVSLVLLASWFPTAAAMATIWWRSDTFAHCLLVPPIVAWLVWRDRVRWLALRPRRWAWGLVPLAAAAVLGLLGELAQVAAASQLALVLALQALTLVVLGPAVTRALAFPLLFLLFAVPIGEFMLPWMMAWTADFTITALRLVGVPVYREGLHFVIPSGHWSVVEACSGVRYLMASVMVGTLFAYLNFKRLSKRLGFVAVAVAVPLLANWLRAFGIVMLGHLSNNQLATGVDHLVYGWVFFGLVMALMFTVGARFAEPVSGPSPVQGGHKQPSGWMTALASLVLLVAPMLVAATLRGGMLAPSPSSLELTVPGWAQRVAHPNWQPAVENPPAKWAASFESLGGEVQFFVAYYPRQQAGSKAVSGENVLVRADDRDWKVLERGGDGWLVKRQGQEEQRFLLQRRHWVDGHLIESPALAKLAHVWQLLRGGGDAAALVVLLTPADAQAQARLQAFWQAASAPLNECLTALSTGGRGHNAGRCR